MPSQYSSEEVRGVCDIKLSTIDNRAFLQIGAEQIEVFDYSIKSSADGETELCVTIKGVPRELELKASLVK